MFYSPQPRSQVWTLIRNWPILQASTAENQVKNGIWLAPPAPPTACEYSPFSLLLAAKDVSLGVPGGEEHGETAVFAG